MLPTVICFMDGVAFDRVVGFEELGGTDEFPTLLLARRFAKSGCIKALTHEEKGEMKIKGKGRRTKKRTYDSSESEDSEN